MKNDLSLDLLERMKLIRCTEETIAERYPENEMRCPTHLSIGQEGAAAGVGAALRREDLAVSGHRAHAHYLAKGGNLDAMIAEIYGKATGCSRGKGGSMHLIDESVGFMGSTAIVAGTVPVGVGLALAQKQRKTGNIVTIFIGDAVIEAGVFYESLNFAILKRLPVLFVCENNLFSVYTPLSQRQPEGRSIHKLIEGFGIPSAHGDGNDAREVHALAAAAVSSVRAGNGPSFLEFSTYRWREHCGPNYDDDIGYRSPDEAKAWRALDPIPRHEKRLIEEGIADRKTIDAIDASIRAKVDAAFAFAKASPFPPASDAFTDLYASQSA
jgi:pyruvate dehydrogenase E1 component alpha subunit